ncbi:MAG: hypothetical protein L0387_16085 [Acidobacteria bacterium]|nr:hypothetical protein [Acidobacteriota bacterium]MCI0724007.1 hypothetical protein [Acidobacteriota bacterium]
MASAKRQTETARKDGACAAHAAGRYQPPAASKGDGGTARQGQLLIGSDPKQWHADVPTYAKVEYQEVYPGVDLVYNGNQRQLEYDFIVAPGANPKAIELAFQGPAKLRIDKEGNVVIGIDDLEVIQRAPVSYQEIDGVRHTITSRYELRDEHRVGFEMGPYDAGRTLVIELVGGGLERLRAEEQQIAQPSYIRFD